MFMKNWRFVPLFQLLKDWRVALCLVASFWVCYLCAAYTHVVIRIVCFLTGAFWLFVSWMFFDRIKLGNEWMQSHTGKAGFPGSVRACILLGLATLGIACVFIFCGIRF